MRPSDTQAWTPVHLAHGERRQVRVREGWTTVLGDIIGITDETFTVLTTEGRNIAFSFAMATVEPDVAT